MAGAGTGALGPPQGGEGAVVLDGPGARAVLTAHRNQARALLFDSPSDPSFDRVTSLVAELLEVPVVLISLVDTDRQFFKSSVGLPEPWCSRRETPLSHSFCQHVVASDAALIIEDARDHPLVRDSLAIPDLDVIAYAGVPVRADGDTIGSLCAIDGRPHAWSADDVRILETFACLVEDLIELRVEALRREMSLDARARVQKRRRRAQAAVHRAALREKRNVEAESRRLQRSLLPRPPNVRINGFSIASIYEPGSRHLLVGGDFADVQARDDGGLDFIIGDVTGHGPEAAALGIALRVTWTALLPERLDTDEIMARLDAAILRERNRPAMLASAIVGVLSPDGARLRLTIAGHPPPIFTSPAPRQLETAVGRGTLLGFRLCGDWPAATVATLGAGVFVHTDGLTEYAGAAARGGERLLLEDIAAHQAAADPDSLLPAGLVDVATARNGAPLTDDVAALHIVRTD